MGRLIYSSIASLDGYVCDENGGFEWAAPDEEVHRFVNDLIRPVGTYLYGRRMYEVMVAWETLGRSDDVEADLTVGGPNLAAAALTARLVDELQVFVVPVVVGAGTAYLPDRLQLDLTLVEERRFGSGVVFVRYRVGA